MAGQHAENLFRRFKGQVVTMKTISGGVYEGRVAEVTNDYVCLIERKDTESAEVYVFLSSVESAMLAEVPSV